MMIKIYADGADYDSIIEAAKNPLITGFTTNPTLMRQAGITDYEAFVRKILPELKALRPDTNISLEVFADDYDNMYRQAHIIHSWGKEYDYNVFVKIPIMNTKGEYNYDLIKQLTEEGVKVNVTAIFTEDQCKNVLFNIRENFTSVIISIFAGRIADTCVDPEDVLFDCLTNPIRVNTEFLWASTREVFNYKQAIRCGCDIITMSPDQIKKLNTLRYKDLTEYSRETVNMFFNDAQKSGYSI